MIEPQELEQQKILQEPQMERMESPKNQRLILISAIGLLFSIGFLCGWLGFLLFGDIAKSCQVVFVSKEALIAAEEARIKNNNANNARDSNNGVDSKGSKDSKDSKDNDDNDNNMFFGKQEEALIQMEQIAKQFENRRTKVLFINSTSGTVKNGTAISDVVHKELVKKLKPKNKEEE